MLLFSEATEFRQISSDALKSWAKCKKRFYYKYVKLLQWPEDQSNFRLGKDVHKLLDYHANGLDCSLLLSQARPDVRISFEKLMRDPISQLPVLANEWAFHVPIALSNGQTEWLTGRIDRIARDEDRVLVIDWKTGTGVPRLPESDWQTQLYRYAVVEVAQSPSASDLGLNINGPLQPEQLVFVYVEVKADTHTPVRLEKVFYDAEKHEATRDQICNVLTQMMAEEEYPLPETCPDRFCQYRTICGIETN